MSGVKGGVGVAAMLAFAQVGHVLVIRVGEAGFWLLIAAYVLLFAGGYATASKARITARG